MKLLRTIMMLLGLSMLVACGQAGGDGQVLRIGSQRGGTKAIMLASGVLKGAPYEVEWSEFPAAQHLLEALGSNAVDVGLVGDAPFIFAYQSGSRIRAIGAQRAPERVAGALALVVPANSPARSIRDLKGKTVATTRGSVGHYLVIRALQAERLPQDWLKLSFLAPGDAKAAFSAGSIQGWATWVPYLGAAYQEGARTIVDGSDFPQGYGFEVASQAAVATKPALLQDFLQREAKALAWARAHPEDFVQVLTRETGLPIETARNYAQKSQRVAVPLDDQVIAAQAEVLETFRRAGAAKGERPVAEAFATGLAPNRVAAAQ
jgi:sulfonate transport system substrate-binding protein